MQSCAKGLQYLKYDLMDTAHWEYIFPLPR